MATNQSIRSLAVDEVAVDVRLELHQSGHAALVRDRFVERGSREDARRAALDRHVEQEAPLLGEFAVEDLVQTIRHFVRHHVGQKAEAAEIHAEQRHVLVDQGACGAQERPITRDDHDKVASPPELVARNNRQIAIGTGASALVVQHDIQSAGAQQADQPSQRLAHPRIAVLGDEPDGLKYGTIQGLCVLGGHTGAGVVEDSGDIIMSAPAGASEQRFCTGPFYCPARRGAGVFSDPFRGAFRCLRAGSGLMEVPPTPRPATPHQSLALDHDKKMGLRFCTIAGRVLA